MNVRESYSRALEQGTLAGDCRNDALSHYHHHHHCLRSLFPGPSPTQQHATMMRCWLSQRLSTSPPLSLSLSLYAVCPLLQPKWDIEIMRLLFYIAVSPPLSSSDPEPTDRTRTSLNCPSPSSLLRRFLGVTAVKAAPKRSHKSPRFWRRNFFIEATVQPAAFMS